MDNCIFCNKNIANGEATVKLGQKGCFTINRVSIEKHDNIFAVPNQRVHTDCRRDYINPNSTRWKKEEQDTKKVIKIFVQVHHNLHLMKIACFVVIRQKTANEREDMTLFVLEL